MDLPDDEELSIDFDTPTPNQQARIKDLARLAKDLAKEIIHQINDPPSPVTPASEHRAIAELRLVLASVVATDLTRSSRAALMNMIDGLSAAGRPTGLLLTAPEGSAEQVASSAEELDMAVGKVASQLAIANSLRLLRVAPNPQEAAEGRLDDIDAVMSALAEKLREANAAVEAIKTAGSEIGVSRHAANFRKLSKDHSRSARIWLIVSVVLLLSWLGAAAYFYDVADNHPGRIAARVAMLGVGLGAVLWAARHYRLNRHNELVNKHRATALDTFETFVNTPEADDEIKKAILLQTTQVIFAPQASGFASEKMPAAAPAVSVLEKAITRAQSK